MVAVKFQRWNAAFSVFESRVHLDLALPLPVPTPDSEAETRLSVRLLFSVAFRVVFLMRAERLVQTALKPALDAIRSGLCLIDGARSDPSVVLEKLPAPASAAGASKGRKKGSSSDSEAV